MSKLFLFGIGGTGNRVVKALTFLLAAGVDLGADELVPVFVDTDLAGGDLTRTKQLLTHYRAIQRQTAHQGADHTNRFFTTPIARTDNDNHLRLANVENTTFEDYIGLSAMPPASKALFHSLYADRTRTATMEVGFKGNPNMGSVVLNQFASNEDFCNLFNHFREGDRIFIVSSIFGGTGASGFPLLLKNLRELQNVADGVNNAALVARAPIGAVTVLPYFTVKANDESAIDSTTFTAKATAALHYYEHNLEGLDALYYIGDDKTTMYENSEGGNAQCNDAHFVELAAALSVIDFARSEVTNDAPDRRTCTYKEYGLPETGGGQTARSFFELCDRDRHLIAPALTRLLLFFNYLNDHGGRLDRLAWYKDHQLGEVLQREFATTHLKAVSNAFAAWLYEMKGQNSRKFIPFHLNEHREPLNIVVGRAPKKGTFGGTFSYNDFDRELNAVSQTLRTADHPEQRLLELFHRTTTRLLEKRLPLA